MRKRDIKLLIILVVASILLVTLINLALKMLNVSSDTEKSEFVVDSVIGSNLSEEEKKELNKYPVYMENVYSNSLTIEDRKTIISFIDEIL